MTHQTKRLIMHKFYAITLLFQKFLNVFPAKYRPIMATYQIFSIFKLQRPGNTVCPLHSIARKRSADRLNIMQTHVTIIGTMQKFVFW